MNKRLDLFGVLIFAFVTAVGGGTLRDLIVGRTPVGWTQNLDYIYCILIAAFVAIVFKSKINFLKKTLFLFDTIGLGIFTIIGVEIGIQYKLHPIISVMLGTMSGSFGGLLRDILSNDIPVILQKEIYASACIIGGATFIALTYTNFSPELNYILTTVLVILIRLFAVKFQLQLPNIYSSQKK